MYMWLLLLIYMKVKFQIFFVTNETIIHNDLDAGLGIPHS
jgi:hypothetical protein